MKLATALTLITTAVLLAIVILLLLLPKQKPAEGLEIVAENLEVPWAMDFLPDGSLIFTERIGKVKTLKEGVLTEIEVAQTGEAGLLGIAIDPDFESNNFIYLYYTRPDLQNRVSKFTLGNLQLINETVLIENIPGANIHDGGRIKFGPDGLLYITTGDAASAELAQDTNSLAGKILRINPDGSIPEDNPFNNEVWSYGHRNPQGIAWDDKGIMFSSEHGPTANDEINIIEKGQNYGWPLVQCPTTEFTAPIRCFSEFTLAPGSIAVKDNNVFVTGLRGQQLRQLTLDENNQVIEEKVLVDNLGRIREVVVGPDGSLYITTSNRDGRGRPKAGDDKIIKIEL